MAAQLILKHARIFTGDPRAPRGEALAVEGGKVSGVGAERDIMTQAGPTTQVVDLNGRTVVPGLDDSHIHAIRGGLHYNLELRWDGVPSVADALRRLREQALRTPAPQWVRVVGGWNEFQFAERRMPTLEELNAAAPDTPVFVLYLYGLAMLNGAALRAVGYTKETPNPPGGEIQRDHYGNPTGLLVARPNAMILYSTLAKGPRLSPEDQANSTRHFLRELNRLGLTSVIDAGGGFQSYPDDYRVIEELHRSDQVTVRIAYNLFTQRPGQELDDFRRWTDTLRPGQGDAWYRVNGAGEMLAFSAADFEDFLEPRPDLSGGMEADLEPVVRLLAEKRWPFRLHATYDESIGRFLSVFERVNRDIPLAGLRWFFDHAETITLPNLERVRALGGGIAVQNRMAFQGEHFLARYGSEAAGYAPPIRRMLEMGIPVGAGTDATRVSSYNPWLSLYWLVTGRTIGRTSLRDTENRMSREEALTLYTHGSAWFSGEEANKGILAPGQFADLAVLSADYFAVPEEDIRGIESVLTIVGGRVVYGAAEFSSLSPPLPPVSPSWSPVATYGGYPASARTGGRSAPAHSLHVFGEPTGTARSWPAIGWSWPGIGCDCFAF